MTDYPRGDLTVTSMLEAIEELTMLMEGAKGLRHPRHRTTVAKARVAIAAVMRTYFARQLTAILGAVKPKIAGALALHPRPSIESALATKVERMLLESDRSPAAKLFADTLIPTSLSPLRFPITASESTEFDRAITAAIAGAAETLGKELSVSATIDETASAKWLRDNSLTKLTGQLSSETTSRLRDAIADAWEEGGSYNQIVSAITDTFADFSEKRAGVIAQTEANDAYNYGRVELATEAGFDEKSWDPDGEACEEICMPNVDEGWIGIDEDFGSGDDAPPGHPNCDCGISFRKTTGAGE